MWVYLKKRLQEDNIPPVGGLQLEEGGGEVREDRPCNVSGIDEKYA